VSKNLLPALTDTPLVFSMNPPKDTFSLKNFSQSSLKMESADAALENKAISATLPKIKQQISWHRFPIAPPSSACPCF
jgi:hypothetical protein